MNGRDIVPVGSYTNTVDDTDHSYASTRVVHYVTSTNNVPSGKIVYVRIQFELSASGTLGEWDLNSVFKDGANKVVLSSVTYYKYVYATSPPGPIQ